MSWIVFSLFTAISVSLRDVFSKKGLGNIDEYIAAWSLRFFGLIFLLPLLFYIDIPTLGNHFWWVLPVGSLLNIIAIILYMRAIKYSDISIVTPLVTFLPLFLLLTSPLIVGEFPTFLGLIGVLLIVLGCYILNIRQWSRGYLAPIRALFREKGPKLMLFAVAIWSITSNLDKIGIQNSSPVFWVIATNVFMALIMFPIMLNKSNDAIDKIRMNYKGLFLIGLFGSLTLLFQMTAISMAIVAYVIAIKQTSIIMNILFGWLIFKEKSIKERLAGAMIMIVGVLFITFS